MEHDRRKTIPVPEAGRVYFNLGRNASYEAARRGELPIVKIGRMLRVPIVALERMLTEAGTDKSRATPSPQPVDHGPLDHILTSASNQGGEPHGTVRHD